MSSVLKPASKRQKGLNTAKAALCFQGRKFMQVWLNREKIGDNMPSW